jgi:tRNA modification GTPase
VFWRLRLRLRSNRTRMFATDDTIVAIATPPGRAGLGVIRVSGPDAQGIAARLLTRRRPLVPRQATLSRVRDPAGAAETAIDQAVVTLFPRPHSYTGEDVVEIAAHGSPVLLEGIVATAVRAGARMAAPGEFTLRAFLNGRVDLVQAEAVADLIEAATPVQARQAFDQLDGTLTRAIACIGEALFDLVVRLEASLDFPDEGYHFVVPDEVRAALARVEQEIDALLASARQGRVIREGRQVAIVGGTNVGKSSLFNAFVGSDRAIVTPIAGTTRDLLTERCDVGGVNVTFVDTAGIRETAEIVEREGVERALGAAANADLVLVVLDRSRPLVDEDRAFIETAGRQRLVVVNKVDLPSAWNGVDAIALDRAAIEVSVRTGAGLSDLRDAIAARLIGEERLRDTAGVSNVRHIELLRRAREAVARAREGAAAGAPEEFLLADIRDAVEAFEEITGRRSSDEVLQAIFSRFCIGK